MSPDTCCIDGYGCPELSCPAACLFPHDNAAYPALLDDEPFKGSVLKHVGSVEPRIEHVCGAQAERVHGTVRHDYGADKIRIYGRFHSPGLFRGYDFRINSGLVAGIHESLLVVKSVSRLFIFRKGNEKTAGIFDTGRSNIAQDAVFLYTLGRRFGILDRISRSAVEQPVIASRSSVGNVVPLYKQGPESPQRAVTRSTGAGNAAADNNHIIVLFQSIIIGYCKYNDYS